MSKLQLIAARDDQGRVLLKSPALGRWLSAPPEGEIASSGRTLGVLRVLGREHELVVPSGVRGVIVERATSVDGVRDLVYGQVVAVLGSELAAEAGASDAAAATGTGGSLVFRSSSSGRFYLRPAPDKPAFVSEGDEIASGQTVFLLEVMKTFSRVAYGGDGLPERARVVRIVPKDGDDLDAGQIVLELEPV